MKTLADLSTPATVTRKLLEKDVQKQCVDWARARGYWARKFSSMTQNSVPDYLFAGEFEVDAYVAVERRPVKFACEFKRPGGKPTEAQTYEMNAMIKAGWVVIWADSLQVFKDQVGAIERLHGFQRYKEKAA